MYILRKIALAFVQLFCRHEYLEYGNRDYRSGRPNLTHLVCAKCGSCVAEFCDYHGDKSGVRAVRRVVPPPISRDEKYGGGVKKAKGGSYLL